MIRPFPAPRAAALIAIILGFVCPLAPSPALAAEEEAAIARTRALVEESHAALISEASAAERAGALRTALEAGFAFDVWGRFLLRTHAETFPEDRLAEFHALLPGYLAGLYTERFGSGAASFGKPEIGAARKARRDVLVRTAVPRANGETLPVDWRIRDFGDRGHLVVDFMVGGASFLLLARDEFNGILESGGPDALLDHMRRKAF